MHPETPVPARARRSWFVPWIFAAVTILGQISWVLITGPARTAVTALTVISFFLASASHALLHRGGRWTGAYLAVTVGIGWLAEALGTATGFPFGTYDYTGKLGPALSSVPLLIPLAWSMMAYPCLLAAQRLADGRVTASLLGAVLFASWDLFLDPQMVAEGYWTWEPGGVELPGIPGIPVSNFIGWLIVALVLMAVLNLLPRIASDDTLPTVMLTWVYLSNVMAAAVFFGRPGVAIWGGIAMGLVIVPWWRRLSRPAPARVGASR